MSKAIKSPDLEASGEKIAPQVNTDAASIEDQESKKPDEFPPLGKVIIIVLAPSICIILYHHRLT